MEEPSVRRRKGLVVVHGLETVQGKGGSGTVADEPLEAVAAEVPQDALLNGVVRSRDSGRYE
jgi:hypothetical protein